MVAEWGTASLGEVLEMAHPRVGQVMGSNYMVIGGQQGGGSSQGKTMAMPQGPLAAIKRDQPGDWKLALN